MRCPTVHTTLLFNPLLSAARVNLDNNFEMLGPAASRPKSSPSYLRSGSRAASPPKRASAPRTSFARRLSATHTNLVSKDVARRLSQGMIKAPDIGEKPDEGHSWSSAAWRHAERRASEQGRPACVPRCDLRLSKVASSDHPWPLPSSLASSWAV